MTAAPLKAANENAKATPAPTKDEAMDAVRTLLRWAGDNPEREGLIDTPKRVVEAYAEWFEGYTQNPDDVLAKTFEEVENYDEMVLLKNMRVVSHCEHHMATIIGRAHIAYMPDKKVVGISKLARLLDIYSHRLQTQETMTSQIADTIQRVLQPKGVAVIIDAKHQCMTTRGVQKHDTTTVTSRLLGEFRTNAALRAEFMALVSSSSVGDVQG